MVEPEVAVDSTAPLPPVIVAITAVLLLIQVTETGDVLLRGRCPCTSPGR